MSELVVVSNRGPATFSVGKDGELVARHGAGGLAPSLLNALAGSDALWIATAMSEGDRRAARQGVPASLSGGSELRLVELAPEVQEAAYHVVANGTLWFLYHGLFDRARHPVFDARWHEAWDGYRQFNRALAEEVARCADEGATVVVNDYHLALVGGFLASLRPDLRTVHFHHTPFCDPEELRVLPSAVARELVTSLASFGACGFHTERWADQFRQCAAAVLDKVPEVFHAPLGTDAEALRAVAASPGCSARRADLLERLEGRSLLFRSDRVELSKNLLRGFLAYEELLEADPGLRDRVTFIARTYPSREDIPEYIAYRHEVERLVDRVNERFGAADHLPIVLEVADDFEASVAALSCYDVLLVNPIRDGMNLVAKEGPAVNDRDGVLALSREAGAFAELGTSALEIEPFDVQGTAAVLSRALAMAPDERAVRAKTVAEIAISRPPARWFEEVAGAARRPSRAGGAGRS
ncbi:MAG: Alpha,alpha-trehalose-phosphate synthase [Acidimicrobiaceae bacterium]|nr:Alpha,alpha-trehalose-phosphate synthase [Acidimicrobiaceae bacterium]